MNVEKSADTLTIDRDVLTELLEVYSSYYDTLDAAFIANNATRLSLEVREGERKSVTKDDFFAWRQRDRVSGI